MLVCSVRYFLGLYDLLLVCVLLVEIFLEVLVVLMSQIATFVIRFRSRWACFLGDIFCLVQIGGLLVGLLCGFDMPVLFLTVLVPV